MSNDNATAIQFEKSSNLQSAVLLPDGRLEVTFRASGKRPSSTYTYANFTEAKFREWSEAKSAGTWFDANVKKRPDLHPVVPNARAAVAPSSSPAEATAIPDNPTTADLVKAGALDPALYPEAAPNPLVVDVATQPPGVVERARLCYERYCANSGWKNFRGDPCPYWPDLPPAIQSHWCAVVLESYSFVDGNPNPVTFGATVVVTAEDAMKAINEKAGEIKAQMDRVYNERNRCAIAFAKMARALGWVVGLAEHDPNDTSWDPEWRTILFVEAPLASRAHGQLSWHLHVSELELVAGLPRYDKPWDGHTTEDKYARLARL